MSGRLGEATSEVHDEIAPFFDDGDTVGKLFAGWRPLDWIAVEGGYVDLGGVSQTQGHPDFSDFTVDHTGYDVFGVFLWDIAVVDLFVKIDVVAWSGDLSLSTLAGPIELGADDEDFAWGLGAQARFGKLAVRLEYEHFDTINHQFLGRGSAAYRVARLRLDVLTSASRLTTCGGGLLFIRITVAAY